MTLTYTSSYTAPPPGAVGPLRSIAEYEVELVPRVVLAQSSATPAQWVRQAADAPNEPTFAFAHTGLTGNTDNTLLLSGFELATGSDVAYTADAGALAGSWPLPGDAVLVGAQVTYARHVAAASPTARTGGNNEIVDVFDDPTQIGIGSDANNVHQLDTLYGICVGNTFASWSEADVDTIAYGSLTSLQYVGLSARDLASTCGVVVRIGIAFSPLYCANPDTVFVNTGVARACVRATCLLKRVRCCSYCACAVEIALSECAADRHWCVACACAVRCMLDVTRARSCVELH
jgi:hypothetical protein